MYLPLLLNDGRMYLNIEGQLWLIDTGSAVSFSNNRKLVLAGESFELEEHYLGFDIEILNGQLSLACEGLLGTDIINRFDWIFDLKNQQARFSRSELPLLQNQIKADFSFQCPIINIEMLGQSQPMFFDTGSQFSYHLERDITQCQQNGKLHDYSPAVGYFNSDSFIVDVDVLGIKRGEIMGFLPETSPLCSNLKPFKVKGILGNKTITEHTLGYHPSRQIISLA
ncbi:hypothetical protein [Paraferrimonas sp. SM1919]|uniref:hypothetical protein n=1 Tax=Paraferrimonas sp. SM1919 TaxID=2662263 RepID=UPI0013D45798|nr:hypothetical protein [Paraferrimonas sp. SM1919]